jgi:primosomal protein N' (replication factor Y) (superfamily II helicase)
VNGTQGELFGGDPTADRQSSGARKPGGVRRRRATPEVVAAGDVAEACADGARVVRVLPDVRGMAKAFDYLVPAELTDTIGLGTLVDVDLGGRRLRGWVVEVDVEAPVGVDLRVLRAARSLGPDASLVALSAWGAWRFAGSRSALLSTASAPVKVPATPPLSPDAAAVAPVAPDDAVAAGRAVASHYGAPLEGVFVEPVTVVRLPPAADPQALINAAAGLGPVLVVTPTARQATEVRRGLRRAGHACAELPFGWGAARRGGHSVVGTRAAAWAPCAPLGSVIVLDEHDESHFQEHTPTWHARTVAVERARAAGVPCVLVSSAPSLEALAAGVLRAPEPTAEQGGWPKVEVVDLRFEDPLQPGIISESLTEVIRTGARVVCVLNRRGRARLLACNGCQELVRCADCGAAVSQGDNDLACGSCGAHRPALCLACGRTNLRAVRRGVTRLREDLEGLVGEPVVELVAGTTPTAATRVMVGTSAALHHVGEVDVVAFVDLDQELLAPRYRAAEESLGLLVLAGRMVGGRAEGRGSVLVQTSLPDHPVVVAAATGDPAGFAAGELALRRELGWPPVQAVALVSGQAAGEFIGGLGDTGEVSVLGPLEDRWMLRAPNHTALCDLLAGAPRPSGRLRIEMDPVRL